MHSGLDTTGLDFGVYIASSNVYHVADGWNLLSLPNSVADPRKSTLYPSAPGTAFYYTGSYVTIDTLRNGQGYWLRFPYSQNMILPGSPVTHDTIPLRPGWNMIGTIANPVAVAAVQQIPDGVVTAGYYVYDGGYLIADSLRPHHGYWARASAGGELVIGGTASQQRSSVNTAEIPSDQLGSLSTLEFSDGSGRRHT